MLNRVELLTLNKHYRIDPNDRVRANIPAGQSALWSGEIRRPKAGEWILKGGGRSAEIETLFAYRAAANLTAEHAIANLSAELVGVER